MLKHDGSNYGIRVQKNVDRNKTKLKWRWNAVWLEIKEKMKRMHLIPETSDPTFAEHQIASEISSASAYGPYSEKDQAECVLTSFFVWFS